MLCFLLDLGTINGEQRSVIVRSKPIFLSPLDVLNFIPDILLIHYTDHGYYLHKQQEEMNKFFSRHLFYIDDVPGLRDSDRHEETGRVVVTDNSPLHVPSSEVSLLTKTRIAMQFIHSFIQYH